MSIRIVDRLAGRTGSEREEAIAGLVGVPARIAPRYFYDELGCALYGAICRLPEYYPTRTEIALFRRSMAEIAAAVGAGRQFVDLGSGDCGKAREWLPVIRPASYVAVDVAGEEIHRSLDRLSADFPDLEMTGVVTDFAHSLELDDVLGAGPATFFYPGSSIGNFTPEEAGAFLARIHAGCATRAGSSLLIGVDGKKDKARLDAAYDDSLGVTAAFNLNALRHLNRRFGFDFDVGAWAHRAFYDEARGRVEMHLEALREQRVRLGTAERRFAAGERIHTENSYKYHPAEFEALLRGAGFTATRSWTDGAAAYTVFVAA